MFDRERFRYPSTAVRQGEVLRVARDNLRPDVPPEIVELIERMLLREPAARPTINEVHATLMKVRKGAPRSATPGTPLTAAATATGPAAAGPAARAGLKGKGLRTASRSTAETYQRRRAKQHELCCTETHSTRQRSWAR
jgi:hypothetical protein